MSANLAASVRARLLNLARAQGAEFNQVLVRFALERMLYRLGHSSHGERFVLKGALLFTLWYDLPHRSTRDADLLGFGASDLPAIRQTFREIAAIDGNDGLIFDPDSVTADEIRKGAGYGGARVMLVGELAKARCTVQIDVGFGDAVTPGPVEAQFPVLIGDLPAPRLRTYPVETVIAEKLHAIELLGMTNSRMKDYLDLSVLIERERLDMRILASALRATFARRKTAMPSDWPIGLTDTFSADVTRQSIWNAFLRKNQLPAIALSEVVMRLREALAPALVGARGTE